MRDLMKLVEEILESDPKLKEMFEQDENYKEQQKQYYMSIGFDEQTATMKSWNDYWQRAKDEHGVEFSINKLK